MKYINRWWIRDIFRLTLEIPYIKIHTELMHRAFAELCYNYIVVVIHIYKWKFEFAIGDNLWRLQNESKRNNRTQRKG